MKLNTRRHIALVLAFVGALALMLIADAGLALEALPPDPEGFSRDSVIFADGISPEAAFAAPSLPAPAPPVALPAEVWRIGITEDGLYSLDYATLAAAGVPVDSVNAGDLHLTWRGQDVPLDATGAKDAPLGPGDALLFYGEKFHGTVQDEKYTDENVYWLSVDAAKPAAWMTSRSVAPGTAPAVVGCVDTTTIEENRIYWARWTAAPRTDTTWFWKRFPTTAGITETFALTLTQPVASQQATLVVELASLADRTHLMRLGVNDVVVGTSTWSGNLGWVVTATVPSGVLVDGLNDLQVYIDDATQTALFDRAELTYVRASVADAGSLVCGAPETGTRKATFTGLAADAGLYDVSDPLQPVALTNYSTPAASQIEFQDAMVEGMTYLAEAPRPATLTAYTPDLDLLDPATGADQIIIAPRAFLSAVQPLVAHRESQGLRVRTVAVEDIYPLFNGGVFHPEAIRALVAHAYDNWPGLPPQYLFLVGDGHYNFKAYNLDNYGPQLPIHIPPYLFFDDPNQGEVPVDARFGDVDGKGLPEVYVGRLPAETIDQVTGYVNKLLTYEASPKAAWQDRAVLIADDGKSYSEGFEAVLDDLAATYLYTNMATVDKVYLRDITAADPLDACEPFKIGQRCVTATQAITEAWNAGAGLMIYAGHGSTDRWAHEPLLWNEELADLASPDQLPFLLSLDCWDSYFMRPGSYGSYQDTRGFGEWVTTVLTGSGAIANFGPAGLSYNYQAKLLSRALFRRLFEEGEPRLGPLTQAAREGIQFSYLSRVFTLLGDPAMALRVSLPTSVDVAAEQSSDTSPLIAGDRLTYTLVFTNQGTLTATNALLTNETHPWLSDIATSYTTSYGGKITPTKASGTAWELGTVPPQGTGTIVLTAQITPGLSDYGFFTNALKISTTHYDADLSNNTSLLTREVIPTFGATLSPGTLGAEGHPGDTVTYELALTNIGSAEDTITLQTGGNAWSTQVTPGSVTLGSRVSTSITISVTIPAGTGDGVTDAVVITAQGSGDSVLAELTTTSRHRAIYLPLAMRIDP